METGPNLEARATTFCNNLSPIVQNWIHCTNASRCSLETLDTLGSLHYDVQIERSLPKFLLRGEGRSSLKYIMSVLLSIFEYFVEKKFHLSTRVWVSNFPFLVCPNSCREAELLTPKVPKNVAM